MVAARITFWQSCKQNLSGFSPESFKQLSPLYLEKIAAAEQRGYLAMVSDILIDKLGDLPITVLERLESLDLEQLRSLGKAMSGVESIDDLTKWLNSLRRSNDFLLAALSDRNLVGLCGHDHIIAMQTPNRMSPPSHRHPAPLRQQSRMMLLLLRHRPDRIGKVQSLLKILKQIDPLDPVFAIYLKLAPIWNLGHQSCQFFGSCRWLTAMARNAFTFS
jgi:hypothetical protein